MIRRQACLRDSAAATEALEPDQDLVEHFLSVAHSSDDEAPTASCQPLLVNIFPHLLDCHWHLRNGVATRIARPETQGYLFRRFGFVGLAAYANRSVDYHDVHLGQAAVIARDLFGSDLTFLVAPQLMAQSRGQAHAAVTERYEALTGQPYSIGYDIDGRRHEWASGVSARQERIILVNLQIQDFTRRILIHEGMHDLQYWRFTDTEVATVIAAWRQSCARFAEAPCRPEHDDLMLVADHYSRTNPLEWSAELFAAWWRCLYFGAGVMMALCETIASGEMARRPLQERQAQWKYC